MELIRIEDISLSQEALQEIITEYKQEIKNKAIEIENLKEEKMRIFENTNINKEYINYEHIYLMNHIKKIISIIRKEIRTIIDKIDTIEKIRNKEKKGA